MQRNRHHEVGRRQVRRQGLAEEAAQPARQMQPVSELEVADQLADRRLVEQGDAAALERGWMVRAVAAGQVLGATQRQGAAGAGLAVEGQLRKTLRTESGSRLQRAVTQQTVGP